ncbi:MAG: hypothetical protein AAB786_01215 [Patescibacteria group bacterium]
MISFNQIQTKFFKKERKFKKESSWLNINFYWKFVLGIVFLAIPLSLFLGYRLFLETDKDFVLREDEMEGVPKIIRKERIDRALEYFSSRKEKSNQIINSPAPIIDPSL